MDAGTPFSLADRSAIDAAFLGLEPTEAGVRFLVEERLARPDDRLFGGTALAVSLAAIERVAGRDVLWATTQLTDTAPVGATVECAVDVLARGHRASQVRVTATHDGRVVFVALGAAAQLKDEADSLVAQAEPVPVVPDPEDCPAVFSLPPTMGKAGWHDLVEMRRAAVSGVEGMPGRLCLWTRMKDGGPLTPARLGFVADVIPLGVSRAAGVRGAGTSLDNSLRVGRLVPSEWVLIDIHPHVAWGGYGTGSALLWSPDGTLMAVASQTASIFDIPFDPLAPIDRPATG